MLNRLTSRPLLAATTSAAALGLGLVVILPQMQAPTGPALPPVTQTEAPPAKPAARALTEAAPEAPNKAALYAEARNVFSAFDGAASLPIKPLATFKAYRPALGVLKPGMRPSPRQAATLCVAVLASGQRFNAAPDAVAVTFPRRFTLAGSDYATENGATADCVSAGLAAYDAEAEAFTVTAKQAAQIRGLLGKRAAPAFA